MNVPNTRICLPIFLLAILLFTARLLGAAPAKEKIQVFDLYLFGKPVGQMKSNEYQVEEKGKTLDAARMTVEISLNRMGESTDIGMDHLEVFSPDGQLLRFRSELKAAMMPQLIEGHVEKGNLIVTSQSGASASPLSSLLGGLSDPTNGKPKVIPWDTKAVSEKQLEKDYKDLIKRPEGTRINHRVFVADLLKTVATTSTLVRLEPRKTNFGDKQLYKIETVLDMGSPVTTNSWVDGEGELYEQEIALGPLAMQAVRVSGNAPKPPKSSISPEIFEPLILRPSKPIANPRHVYKAVYRLKYKDHAPGTFYQDDHQKVLSTNADGTMELQVQSATPGQDVSLRNVQPPPNGQIFLEATSMVQSNDPAIQAIAKNVAQGQTNAWVLAKKLERWVYENLTEKNLSVAFASAKETLETREGDCSEHATLLVALLRAAGLPARAAEGVVYAESIGGFGYHMWTEVYLDGAWYDLDATRPAPMTDATHIQMGASSMDHTTAADLSMQLLKYLGQFTIDVDKAE